MNELGGSKSSSQPERVPTGGVPADRPSKLRLASFVISGAGVVTWFAYLVLRYGQERDVPPLLWTALGLVVIGFAIRRSQQSA